MALVSSFCGLLTLQVGVAVLAAVFFTLAAVILAANVFDYHNSSDGWPVNLVLMIFFVVGLIIIGVLMFASSYSENRRAAILAVLGIVILLCYWIILCCFSFFSIPSHVRAVCIDNMRCPESLWIANLGYRGVNDTSANTTKKVVHQLFDEADFFHTGFGTPVHLAVQSSELQDDVTWKNSTEEETTGNRHKRYTATQVAGFAFYRSTVFLGVQKFLEINIIPLDGATKIKVITDAAGFNAPNNDTTFKNVFFDHNYDQTFKMYFELNETKEEDEELSHIRYGFPFIGAIILFVANLLFFIFAALTMWSWASELDWADYYVEDEPVIIYEED